eukprot:scaffold11332_cov94-Isochrysis_galbana.AAC.8
MSISLASCSAPHTASRLLHASSCACWRASSATPSCSSTSRFCAIMCSAKRRVSACMARLASDSRPAVGETRKQGDGGGG